MDRLEFVTVEGLLAYGELLASRIAGEGIAFPPSPLPQSIDCSEPMTPWRRSERLCSVRKKDFLGQKSIGLLVAW